LSKVRATVRGFIFPDPAQEPPALCKNMSKFLPTWFQFFHFDLPL
jgi:hypothetical protein